MQYRLHGSNTIHENQAAMIFEICWILAVHLPQQVNADWFTVRPSSERVLQLLNSIHVFGMDRVLSVMLAGQLADHPELAIQLLDPGDPTRAVYLSYITEALSSQMAKNGVESARAPQQIGWSGTRLLRKIAARLKRLVQ